MPESTSKKRKPRVKKETTPLEFLNSIATDLESLSVLPETRVLRLGMRKLPWRLQVYSGYASNILANFFFESGNSEGWASNSVTIYDGKIRRAIQQSGTKALNDFVIKYA